MLFPFLEDWTGVSFQQGCAWTWRPPWTLLASCELLCLELCVGACHIPYCLILFVCLCVSLWVTWGIRIWLRSTTELMNLQRELSIKGSESMTWWVGKDETTSLRSPVVIGLDVTVVWVDTIVYLQLQNSFPLPSLPSHRLWVVVAS